MGRKLAEKIKRSHRSRRHRRRDPDPGLEPPGGDAARGRSSASTYREGFVKNRYIGRTFIMPGQAVRRKLGAPEAECHVDRVQGQERPAGGRLDRARHHQRARSCRWRATRARTRCSSPRPRRRCAIPNVYGIDMPTRAELIATGRSEDEIAREIGADALIYQDLEALKDTVRQRQSAAQQLRGLVLRRRLRHRRRDQRLPARHRDPARRGRDSADDDNAQLDLNWPLAALIYCFFRADLSHSLRARNKYR